MDKNLNWVEGTETYPEGKCPNCLEDWEESTDVPCKSCGWFTPPRPETDACPYCGHRVTRDEVDIGVGTQKGPPHCDSCGWHEKAFKEVFRDEN